MMTTTKSKLIAHAILDATPRSSEPFAYKTGIVLFGLLAIVHYLLVGL